MNDNTKEYKKETENIPKWCLIRLKADRCWQILRDWLEMPDQCLERDQRFMPGGYQRFIAGLAYKYVMQMRRMPGQCRANVANAWESSGANAWTRLEICLEICHANAADGRLMLGRCQADARRMRDARPMQREIHGKALRQQDSPDTRFTRFPRFTKLFLFMESCVSRVSQKMHQV